MPNLVIAVVKLFNATIHRFENRGYIDALNMSAGTDERLDHVGIREHLAKIEASTQGRIKQGDGSIRGVHRSEDVKILGYAKHVV